MRDFKIKNLFTSSLRLVNEIRDAEIEVKAIQQKLKQKRAEFRKINKQISKLF